MVRGTNPGWGEIFRTCPDPGAHPASCAMRSGRGVTLTPHLLLVPWSTPPMDCTACTEPQCLYKDVLYLFVRI